MNNLNVKDQSFGPIQHLIDDEAVERSGLTHQVEYLLLEMGKVS